MDVNKVNALVVAFGLAVLGSNTPQGIANLIQAQMRLTSALHDAADELSEQAREISDLAKELEGR